MRKLPFCLLILALFCISGAAQTATTASTASTATTEKPKKTIFRANKAQITEVQTKLKTANLYTGEATGKLDDATRASIKAYQNGNGLKDTGTLNRATLEKMGIELTDTQKAIPVSESSYASAATTTTSTDAKPKKVIFRATKEQITEAQRMLKAKTMYGGEETGKLDDATREGLKKFQEGNGLKVTGTLNQVTLEKMGIALTDKQKANAAAAASATAAEANK